MNQESAEKMLVTLFLEETRGVTVILLGPPGSGKTAIGRSAAEAAGKKFFAINLTTCDETDLRGRQEIRGDRTVCCSPLPHGPGVLMLDELTSAPPAVQTACHHIIAAELGSDIYPDPSLHKVCTGNQSSDRAIYRAMPSPVRNRLAIIAMTPELGCWSRWALRTRRVAAEVLSFLTQMRPTLFFAQEIPADGPFPTPRAWEAASRVIELNFSAEVEAEMVAGLVGEGPAREFSSYLASYRQAPGLSAIMSDPAGAPVPTDPALLYARAVGLAWWSREHSASAMQYISRIPAEYALLYVREARDYIQLAEDPLFAAWCAKHKKLFAAENY